MTLDDQPQPSNTHWTPARDDELRALWAGSHTGADIARRMGITRAAVYTQAKRLDLPRRPNPVPAAAAHHRFVVVSEGQAPEVPAAPVDPEPALPAAEPPPVAPIDASIDRIKAALSELKMPEPGESEPGYVVPPLPVPSHEPIYELADPPASNHRQQIIVALAVTAVIVLAIVLVNL